VVLERARAGDYKRRILERANTHLTVIALKQRRSVIL
jgi:hypothetical protein